MNSGLVTRILNYIYEIPLINYKTELELISSNNGRLYPFSTSNFNVGVKYLGESYYISPEFSHYPISKLHISLVPEFNIFLDKYSEMSEEKAIVENYIKNSIMISHSEAEFKELVPEVVLENVHNLLNLPRNHTSIEFLQFKKDNEEKKDLITARLLKNAIFANDAYRAI